MSVKIVTDSTVDLLPETIKELGITVVPVYVMSGNKTYRDGLDISQTEIYNRMLEGEQFTTSQPTPADFANAYKTLSKETDQIVSLIMGAKLSGTYNSALQGRELAQSSSNIELIDTKATSGALGLLATQAAEMAKMGESAGSIVNSIKSYIPQVHIWALLDTIKYVLKSGRLSSASNLISGVLSIRPMLTLRDGSLWPASIHRTRNKGIEKLTELVKNNRNLEAVQIVQSVDLAEAHGIKEKLADFIDQSKIHISQLGPALGVHGGPGTLVVAIREKLSGIGTASPDETEDKKSFKLPSIHLPKLGFSSLH
ncbi:MAG: degV family protein [Dehalococcoides mccartyi]|uniref:DegV family protein n=1 Tax=Dehalococcoides mccartyi TaxID=61435 RepID=UPI0009900E36|nr:DegV family protein [Dehalococcoides mccartyi]AQU03503.1 fatty acid-binding protein DegV [Dehalococcoides mccartyi]AQU04801.1 fatty acid-binding protein DegV [Dehalococcoides mccartyi]MCF7635804.1 degV family protein [Dehalococcoides mccartyi]MEA2121507.1 DegV domain-containing protein [Dehalococcoides mccartyi]MEA2123051.1 DegV domain-containing protein [Dehalococcoides mccartyi]